MTILVTIVSKQTIPNILFIKEKQQAVDKFVFINTAYTVEGKFSKRIEKVCRIKAVDVVNVQVAEEDTWAIRKAIADRLQEEELSLQDKYLVNITGGTKLMMLGVQSFFNEKTTNAEFYYIAFPNTTKYQKLHLNQSPEWFDLSNRINLEDYLLAHGINIASKQEALFKSFEYTKELTLLDMENNKTRKKQDREHTEDDKRYYQWNGFFEEYMYAMFKTHLQLDDAQIGLSVKTLQPITDVTDDADHEIDIMFVYENHLYVVECKTGIREKLFEEMVFRLYSIKERLGFSSGYIALLQEFRDTQNQLPPLLAKKAKPSGIYVLEGKDIKQETGLLNAIQHIKQKYTVR